MGYDEAQCLDFDFGLIDFWNWYKAKADEQVVGKVKGRQPKKNETWVKKYKNSKEIIQLYYKQGDPRIQISEEIRSVTDEAIMSIVDESFGGALL